MASNPSAVFGNPSILDNILFHSDVSALCTLSKTCRAIRASVQVHAVRRWDINKALGHFVPDPLFFRTVMARTGSVLTGTLVWAFLIHDSCCHYPLEICTSWSHATELLDVFIDRGYTVDESHPTEPRTADMDPVTILEHGYPSLIACGFKLSQGNKTVRLLVYSRALEPSLATFQAVSTCFMNFITWDRVYCLYPAATFHARSTLIVAGGSLSTHHRRNIDMARSSGFTVYENDRLAPRRLFPHGPHHTSDSTAWSLLLDTTGIFLHYHANSTLPWDHAWEIRSGHDGICRIPSKWCPYFHTEPSLLRSERCVNALP